MEDSLFVGFDANNSSGDIPVITTLRKTGDEFNVITTRTGEYALNLYKILTNQDCKFKISE